ncbi:alpha/beta hydrolase [Undibacterium sp. TS12]|uniref:alpha/beta fold hydrolase n=1 Tax=Undibacterium sp. TS12 TaxID=2908202 RepID=UPI001F4CAA04|nr:alpha/beta hydrolase [Undibacterium sp. TS12]MCH8617512.1 alpha/beta hydrolase [Undibacterium sp. TS12]
MSIATTSYVADLDNGLAISYTESGTGQTILILHGGGGPATVAGIVSHLASSSRTVTPVHPGWNGTTCPEYLDSVAALAQAYLLLLEKLDLYEVIVLGSSIGGWIAAEMALRDMGKRIKSLILMNAAGVHVDGEVIADVFTMGARGVAEHAFHQPDKFYVDPSTVSVAQQAMQRANMATLRKLAGDPYMHDPQLLGKLGQIQLPALFVWGESDRIVTPAYGLAYAHAFANARFELIPQAGHMPHMEQPEKSFAVIDSFIQGSSPSCDAEST